MRIGIVFAMEEELDALRKYISIDEVERIYDLKFFCGTYQDFEIILVESGVGKVNASRATQIMIDKMEVDYIFNIGVAGGIDSGLEVCDIIIGEELVQYDFDISIFNHKLGYIPKVGDSIKSDQRLLSLAKKVIKGGKCGIIASGDKFLTDIKLGEFIKNEFGALAVEMEGASVAQTAYLSGIPFLIIRSISDVLNNNNKIMYEEFLNKSCDVVAVSLLKIIESIKSK